MQHSNIDSQKDSWEKQLKRVKLQRLQTDYFIDLYFLSIGQPYEILHKNSFLVFTS